MNTQLQASIHPFKTDTIDRVVPDRLTLVEMIDLLELDPILINHSHVWIGDQYIKREYWRVVRPKPGAKITFKVVPQGGGGGGGGKSPLRTVLTIAVIAASFYFGPMLGGALGAPAGTLNAAEWATQNYVFGSLSYAALGGGIIAVAGTLLVNAIAPIRPPKLGDLSGISIGGSSQQDSPTLFIEGARNEPRPFAPVPSVLGIHRNVPPLGTKTYTEVVGDDAFLRMLVVWGYGPLKIENVKIAETPIEDFQDVQIEHREGRDTDTPHTLIPDTVLQTNISILLTQVDGWRSQTFEPNADELSVDITCPNGLVHFDDSGGRAPQSVSFEIQYREVGAVSWSNLPTNVDITDSGGITTTYSYTDVDGNPSLTSGAAKVSRDLTTTIPADQLTISSGELTGVTLTAARTSAIRHGLRWKVPARGNYEVQIRRTTTDTDDTRIFDKLGWTAYRTIRNENPVNFPFPLATTELVIKATDQLSGSVDELNATTSSYVLDWDGSSWSEAISNNPASLYRHVVQGNANARGLADARVDLDQLELWHEFNATNGFTFNMIRDFQASVYDTLADIAAAGRASPAQNDGLWSVNYDYQQSTIKQHFTPRNSWGFEAEKNFPDQPDAFRVRFQNETMDYRQDERLVYADGFTSANAANFDGLDAVGITNPDHVWKFGRFQIAQAKLRPERWSLNVDFEFLTARRGNLVAVTHDVLSVGLKSGRIKSLVMGGSPSMIVGFVSDEILTMRGDKSYSVAIRTVENGELVKPIVTSAGDQTTITFTTSIDPAVGPAAGDLFSFGYSDSEYIEGLVLLIEPASELSAKITCIPHSPAIYNADTGPIPSFDTKLNERESVPMAEIANIRTDESVLTLGAGNTLVPHLAISIVPITYRGASLDIQIRSSGTNENFYDASVSQVSGNDYFLSQIEQGNSYDLRVRWRDPNRLAPVSWTYAYNNFIIGQTNPPSGITGATLSVFGGQAFIRWDRPPELDVRFGGTVKFRHTPNDDLLTAEWASSTSIGTTAQSDALFASLPLKPGIYLARVYDKGGRPSDTVTMLATKQASVLAFSNVDTLTESPTFSGTKTDCRVTDSYLTLDAAGDFDDIPDLDEVSDLDSFGGAVATGTYEFAGNSDLLTVKRVRLTSVVDATSVNVNDRIDERTAPIDTWEDFDGIAQSTCDCRVQVRQTDDDPAGSPTWSVWNDLDSAEFEARAFEFRAILTSNDPAFNIRVDSLGVVIEEI